MTELKTTERLADQTGKKATDCLDHCKYCHTILSLKSTNTLDFERIQEDEVDTKGKQLKALGKIFQLPGRPSKLLRHCIHGHIMGTF